MCHCTSLSPWFIILDKNNFVNVSHHYWIPIWASMYSMLEWRSGGSYVSWTYYRRSHTDPQKFFFPYKQVSGRICDHEWFRITNAFILCDLLRKIQKSHAANRERSFKHHMNNRIGTELLRCAFRNIYGRVLPLILLLFVCVRWKWTT